MGLISAITALLRVVPVLERLVLQIADALRESKAKSRHEAKIDNIDVLIDGVRVSHNTVEVRQRDKDNASKP
jgi:hypothetical protein